MMWSKVEDACKAGVDVARKASRFREPDDVLCEYAVKKLYGAKWQKAAEEAIGNAYKIARSIGRKGFSCVNALKNDSSSS